MLDGTAIWIGPEAHAQAAERLRQAGNLAGAREEAQKAVALRPDDVGIRLLLGGIAKDAGDRDRARGAFAAALAKRPTDPEASLGMAELLLAEGRTRETLSLLESLPVGLIAIAV
jgi:Flp pilus assembly protein TadD